MVSPSTHAYNLVGFVGDSKSSAYSGFPAKKWISITYIIGNDSNPKSPGFSAVKEHFYLHGYE